MPDQADTYRSLDLALRIGEVLLSSGAGAADVAAGMLAVARATGLRHVTADVTFTQLTLTEQPDGEVPALVQQRRVTYRTIDYEDLTEVDHLVRDLIMQKIDRDQARARLARLLSSGHHRARWKVSLGWGVMGGGVAFLLGGSPTVAGLAFVAAILIDQLQRFMARRRWPVFYQQVGGGLVASLVAVGAAATSLDVKPSLVVTAGIVMLLSGLGFVGATQDALTGYPMTAGARFLEVMFATAGITAGVSAGLTIGRLLGVDVGRVDPGAYALAEASVVTIGAAVSAAAFAYASYAPARSLVPVAVVAAVGEIVVLWLRDSSLGGTWATAAAAVAVGLLSYSVAGWVRVPPLLVVVSGVVPLLPGLAIYRGLTLLGESGGGGIFTLSTAATTALALASGVLLGQYIAQPLRREARRIESRLAGPRLVGPLRLPKSRR